MCKAWQTSQPPAACFPEVGLGTTRCPTQIVVNALGLRDFAAICMTVSCFAGVTDTTPSADAAFGSGKSQPRFTGQRLRRAMPLTIPLTSHPQGWVLRVALEGGRATLVVAITEAINSRRFSLEQNFLLDRRLILPICLALGSVRLALSRCRVITARRYRGTKFFVNALTFADLLAI